MGRYYSLADVGADIRGQSSGRRACRRSYPNRATVRGRAGSDRGEVARLIGEFEGEELISPAPELASPQDRDAEAATGLGSALVPPVEAERRAFQPPCSALIPTWRTSCCWTPSTKCTRPADPTNPGAESLRSASRRRSFSSGRIARNPSRAPCRFARGSCPASSGMARSPSARSRRVRPSSQPRRVPSFPSPADTPGRCGCSPDSSGRCPATPPELGARLPDAPRVIRRLLEGS